jgi:hypothetical protein
VLTTRCASHASCRSPGSARRFPVNMHSTSAERLRSGCYSLGTSAIVEGVRPTSVRSRSLGIRMRSCCAKTELGQLPRPYRFEVV